MSLNPDSGWELEIVCTNHGQHGRWSFGRIFRTAQGRVDVVPLRRAPTGKAASVAVTVDGEEPRPAMLHNQTLIKARDITDDFDGRRRFRFNCPRCSLDQPMSEESAACAIENSQTLGQRVVNLRPAPNA